MQQELLLNIIPFNSLAGKQTVSFYKKKLEVKVSFWVKMKIKAINSDL
jgi:hypothetical protein